MIKITWVILPVSVIQSSLQQLTDMTTCHQYFDLTIVSGKTGFAGSVWHQSLGGTVGLGGVDQLKHWSVIMKVFYISLFHWLFFVDWVNQRAPLCAAAINPNNLLCNVKVQPGAWSMLPPHTVYDYKLQSVSIYLLLLFQIRIHKVVFVISYSEQILLLL